MGKLIWILKALVIIVLSTVIFGSAAFFAYELFYVPNIVPPEEAHIANKPPPDPSLPEFEKVMKVVKARKLAEAQSALILFIDHYPFSTKLDEAKDALGKINITLFFSPEMTPDKIRYEVARGDALAKIERKLKTTRELLMKCNSLDDPRRLSIGQVLYVPQTNFTVTIDRARKTVTLLNQNRFFKQYKASAWNVPAIKPGSSPVISAKVRDKIAWHEGRRVFFGTKEYTGSARWVELTAKGFTFYGEGGPKPDLGIGFTPEEMEELSTLLDKNDPVSIQ